MITLDASAALDALLGTRRAPAVLEHFANESVPLIAPEALLIEVPRVLRRHTLANHLTPERAQAALDDLLDLDVLCYETAPLVGRAWELRHNFSFDDALYVALSEATGATLLTTDVRLGQAAMTYADIRVATA